MVIRTGSAAGDDSTRREQANGVVSKTADNIAIETATIEDGGIGVAGINLELARRNFMESVYRTYGLFRIVSSGLSLPDCVFRTWLLNTW
jgi:hypothetical protein